MSSIDILSLKDNIQYSDALVILMQDLVDKDIDYRLTEEQEIYDALSDLHDAVLVGPPPTAHRPRFPVRPRSGGL